MNNKLPTKEEYETEATAFMAEHSLWGMHNDICILNDTRLVRLIGFHSDRGDHYYKVMDFGGRITFSSCVGSLFSLKDIYPRYEFLEQTYNINHCPRTETFEITFDFEMEK